MYSYRVFECDYICTAREGRGPLFCPGLEQLRTFSCGCLHNWLFVL